MGSLSDLTVKLGMDIRDFETKLQTVSKKMNKVSSSMQSVGKNLTMSVTAPIVGLSAVAVNAAIDMERLSTQLNVLTGSAEEGAKAFERIKKFSASTPFQLGDLVSVNNQLIGFGLSTDEAFNSLQMLGDAAAIAGADLNRVAIAYGQSAAAGRVMTQDLNQFVNNGIPIYKILKDVTGKNSGELRELASAGELTFDILEQGFAAATSEGGRFFEGTKQLSQTLGGQLSTLRDNFTLLMSEIGKMISESIDLPSIFKSITNSMQGMANWFRALSPEMKKLIVVMGGIAAAAGPVIAAIGGITAALSFLAANPIVLIIAAIAALAAAVVLYWDEITEAFEWGINKIIDGLNWFIDIHKDMVVALVDLAIKAGDALNIDTSGLKKARKEIDEFTNAIKVGHVDFTKTKKEVEKPVETKTASTDTQTTNKVFNLDEGGGGVKTDTTDWEDDYSKAKTSYVNFKEAMIQEQEDYNNRANELVKQKQLNGQITEEEANILELENKISHLDALMDIEEEDSLRYLELQNQKAEAENQIKQNQVETEQALLEQRREIAAGTISIASATLGAMQSIAGENKALAFLQIGLEGGKAIATGIAQAAKVGFPANLGAIATTIATIGSGITQAKKMASGAFANGGMVFGPTMALVGEGSGTTSQNPEVIAPLDKLKSYMGDGMGGMMDIRITGELVGQGQDLIAVIDTANQNNFNRS